MEIKTEIKKIKMYKAVGFLASVSCIALLGLNLQQSSSVRQMAVDGANRDKVITEIARTNAQLVQSVKVLAEDNKTLTNELRKEKGKSNE